LSLASRRLCGACTALAVTAFFIASTHAQSTARPVPSVTTEMPSRVAPQAPRPTSGPVPRATGVAASAPAPAVNVPVVEVNGGSSAMIETQRVVIPAAVKTRRSAVETTPTRIMTVGEVSTINLPAVTRIAIGNGKLVKATVVDETQIVLLAESVGDTTMHVWLRGGREIQYTFHVLAQRHEQLLSDLNKYVRDFPSLKVRMLGERIVLEGRYPDSETANRFKLLTGNFPQVLNLVAERPADADPLRLERMVQLNLRVIEVKKTALDQLGIKWANTSNGPTFATNALGYANTPWRPDASLGFPPVTTKYPIASYLGIATMITSALTFLEQRGDAWTLAEPQLSCRSGGESKFIAGGEIPIPVGNGLGSTTVVYKQYGVLVEFKPVADGNGNIDSHILIEVSEPDSRNSNQGFVAFTTNRAESQVALREGEPLVIAGLLRKKTEKSSDSIPGLGRIPFLSYLFGAREVRTEQTELFLIVVPHVVVPNSFETMAQMERAQSLAKDAISSANEKIPDSAPPLPGAATTRPGGWLPKGSATPSAALGGAPLTPSAPTGPTDAPAAPAAPSSTLETAPALLPRPALPATF